MDDKQILVMTDDEAREDISDMQDQIFVLEEEMRTVKTILLKLVAGVTNG